MKIFKPLLVLSILIVLGACTKNPVPFFNYEKTRILENDSVKVTFTNKSKDAASYIWEFGDGFTSSEINPTHYYTQSSSFKVTLKALSKDKKKITNYNANITIERDSFKFKAIVAGVQKNFAVVSSSDYDIVNDNYSNFPNSYKAFGSAIFDKSGFSNSRFEIKIGYLEYAGSTVTLNQFYSLVKIKSYNYVSSFLTQGAEIRYYDNSGKIWSTNLSSANQSGSTFKITYLKAKKNIFDRDEIEFKAFFNAKLYDVFGNTLEVKDGYMYSVFGEL